MEADDDPARRAASEPQRRARGRRPTLSGHRALRQRLLQLGGQRHRVREDLGVVHRHRSGFGEQFSQRTLPDST
jgi:hypothetical protein